MNLGRRVHLRVEGEERVEAGRLVDAVEAPRSGDAERLHLEVFLNEQPEVRAQARELGGVQTFRRYRDERPFE